MRLVGAADGGVGVERFGHLVADDVNEALKHRLHVDVLLR